MSPIMSRTATRALPPRQRLSEFPPRMVVAELSEVVGPDGGFPAAVERAVTWPAHLGYGVAAGAVFGVARRHVPDGSGAGNRLSAGGVGALFGLAVWAAGYAGWLPAIGLRESTVVGPRSEIPIPLAAHIVFGVTTALLHSSLLHRSPRLNWNGPQSATS